MQIKESKQEHQVLPGSEISSLQKIGGKLKLAREEKNLSANQLAGSLKIGEEQLIALESGNANLLPEEVFIKAMIRRVAEKLHLDGDVLLSDLNGNNSSSNELAKENDKQIPNKNFFRFQNRKLYLISLVVFILASLSIFYLQRFSTNNEEINPPSLRNLQPKVKDI